MHCAYSTEATILLISYLENYAVTEIIEILKKSYARNNRSIRNT